MKVYVLALLDKWQTMDEDAHVAKVKGVFDSIDRVNGYLFNQGLAGCSRFITGLETLEINEDQYYAVKIFELNKAGVVIGEEWFDDDI